MKLFIVISNSIIIADSALCLNAMFGTNSLGYGAIFLYNKQNIMLENMKFISHVDTDISLVHFTHSCDIPVICSKIMTDSSKLLYIVQFYRNMLEYICKLSLFLDVMKYAIYINLCVISSNSPINDLVKTGSSLGFTWPFFPFWPL